MTLWAHLTVIALLLQCAPANKKGQAESSKPSCPHFDIIKEIVTLKQLVADLSQQVMMQQFFSEERARTDGDSGIKTVRGTKKGLKNYEAANHLSPAAFAIHDHSNYDRTVGLGELDVVLNGIGFRTRHNDYKLVTASRKSSKYHAVEDIPFPGVPPEVSRKRTVEEQIKEMREWFKAFQNQDSSKRDYTQYFKPVLCYLEGAWTLDQEIEEPFPSDRHWLDATSWADLREKLHWVPGVTDAVEDHTVRNVTISHRAKILDDDLIITAAEEDITNRFTAYTGVKNRLENIASLPTTIMSVNPETGKSQYAQWNYRILCSPVNYDIPRAYLYQEDDLSFRVDTGQTILETANSRAARFKLFDPKRKMNNQILDDIFASIPGKDNHGSNLTFTVFGEEMFNTAHSDKNVLLNSAYYHRSYKSFKSGAGGITYAALGFNDENMWIAQTKQPRVAPLQTEQCILIPKKMGKFSKRCRDAELRVSYAIPLEIIYMTPLLSWNPYRLTFHQDIETATKNGRKGGKETEALNGIDKVHYYMTPAEFFSGPLDRTDPADTVKNYIHVLAPDGQVKKVSSSGTRIILQDIEGVGRIRLRYPIAPVHGEGSSVWKEVNALKDKVLESAEGPPSSVLLEMAITVQDPSGEHSHELRVTYSEFKLLLAGQQIDVTTEESQEHTHDLTVIYVPKTKLFKYTRCDGQLYCLDGHPPPISLETKTVYTELP